MDGALSCHAVNITVFCHYGNPPARKHYVVVASKLFKKYETVVVYV